MKVICIERLDYVSKKDGHPVKGYNIYTAYESKNFTGLKPSSKPAFLSDEKYASSGVKIGSEVVVNYNEFGKVRNIEIVE